MTFLLLLFLQESKSCAECHVEQAEVERSGSVHFRERVGCRECHGDDTLSEDPRVRNPHTPEFRSRTSRSRLTVLCGACHASEREAFETSAHHRPKEPDAGPPMRGCMGCHDFHGTTVADRKAISAACLKCHPPGTREDGEWLRCLESWDAFDGNVGRTRDHAVAIASRPGLDAMNEEIVVKQGIRFQHEFRVRQHSLDYTSLIPLLEKEGGSLDSAYNSLNRKESRFRLRFVGLAVFLALIGMSMALLRKKALRGMKP